MTEKPWCLLGLIGVMGCGGTPTTNPCTLYERAVEECHTAVEEALGRAEEDETFDPQIRCPDEEDMSDDEHAHYTCVHDVWSSAECASTADLLTAAIDAADCG
jgi:hypothetical protein